MSWSDYSMDKPEFAPLYDVFRGLEIEILKITVARGSPIGGISLERLDLLPHGWINYKTKGRRDSITAYIRSIDARIYGLLKYAIDPDTIVLDSSKGKNGLMSEWGRNDFREWFKYYTWEKVISKIGYKPLMAYSRWYEMHDENDNPLYEPMDFAPLFCAEWARQRIDLLNLCRIYETNYKWYEERDERRVNTGGNYYSRTEALSMALPNNPVYTWNEPLPSVLPRPYNRIKFGAPHSNQYAIIDSTRVMEIVPLHYRIDISTLPSTLALWTRPGMDLYWQQGGGWNNIADTLGSGLKRSYTDEFRYSPSFHSNSARICSGPPSIDNDDGYPWPDYGTIYHWTHGFDIFPVSITDFSDWIGYDGPSESDLEKIYPDGIPD